jgi:hypothetical protein
MRRLLSIPTALLALALGLCLQVTAQQGQSQKPDLIEPAAIEALKQMGAYLGTLEDFQVQADSTSEDVLTTGEKLQFHHTTNILAHKPNKLRAEVKGERKERLYLYDGKTFTLFAPRAGYYATVAAPPSIAELIGVAKDKYDLDIPLLDLFLWGGPGSTTNEITSAADFGEGEVGGVTCEHYAFRQFGLDWQIWIQLGDHPLPRKLVLTTTTDEARPQHTSVLNWNLAPSYNEVAFTFDPPRDAHRIVFAKSRERAGAISRSAP